MKSSKAPPEKLLRPRRQGRGLAGMAVIGLFGVCSVGALFLWLHRAPEAERQARAAVAARIQERMVAESARALEPRHVAEDLGVAWPLAEPAMSREQALATAESAWRAAVEARFPRIAAIVEADRMAKQLFRVHRIGERIALRIRGGQGVYTNVEGVLEAVTEERVQISGRWVTRQDIQPADLVRLDREHSERRIAEYVAEQIRLVDANREAYARAAKPQVLRQAMGEAGYVYSEEQAEWLSEREAFDKELTRRRAALEARLTAEEYTAAGYFAGDGAWHRDNAWGRLLARFSRR